MNHGRIIHYSLQPPSLCVCSGVTLKTETKVLQREEEGGGVFFKGQVLRKAFLPVGRGGGFVVSEAAVGEFHFRRSDIIIRSSPRRRRSSSRASHSPQELVGTKTELREETVLSVVGFNVCHVLRS